MSFQLSRAYLKKGDAEKSLVEMQTYIDGQRQSKRQSAYDLFADILKTLGRSAELLPRLEKAAEKDPRNPFLQLYIADQYAAADRLEQAEALFKKTLAVSADARGYAGLAGVYRRQNRTLELIAALGGSFGESGSLKLVDRELRAIVSDKALLNSVLQAGRDQAQKDPGKLKYPACYVLAHLATEGRQTDIAVEFYRFLLRIRGDRRPALYEELGQHLINVRRFDQAADLYKEAYESAGTPNERPQFLNSRAYALALGGHADEALSIVRSLIGSDEKNAFYLFREAWILGHARRFDESIRAYEKLLADFSDRPQLVRIVRSGLSNVYVAKGDILKGEQILEEVFRESPEDISVNNDLGYLYADQGKNLEQAEKMLRKAVEAEPENGAYLDSLGWVLFRLGNCSGWEKPRKRCR
ncbi:MAG: tetratricopeptide repeat protein [Planctomycetota bacterium]|nr:tetratricopeptide repeat protein [Planctomycetota bacterium]